MSNMNFEVLYKLSQEFEEKAPDTRPTGVSNFPIGFNENKPSSRSRKPPMVEESISDVKTKAREKLSNYELRKYGLLYIKRIYDNLIAAKRIITDETTSEHTELNKEHLFHPSFGLDLYLDNIEENVRQLNILVGR